jgi:putative membrane protein
LSEAGFILLLVCPFSIPDQFFGAESWRVLYPPKDRPPRLKILLASWMGSAINTLLPVATIGGEIVKARVIVIWKYPATEAAATITADKTIQAIAVLIWGIIGTSFLIIKVGPSDVVTGILIGSGLLTIGIFGFIIVQLKGGLTKIANKISLLTRQNQHENFVNSTIEFQNIIQSIYADPNRLIKAIIFRLLQRVILIGEVLLASYIFDLPIGITEAIILKGIIGSIRGLSFAVPAGLGIQEGGYIAIGALIGYPPDLMIAISLATRLREVLPNIPFLFLWQSIEGQEYSRRTNI